MNFDSALLAIAAQCNLSASDLWAFADEDTLGGYHPDPRECRCPAGSLWGVEGQVLYALVRALKPVHIVEFGSWVGCSARHMASALKANGGGVLTCVDPYPGRVEIDTDLRPYVEVIGATAQTWLPEHELGDVGFLFEDTYHDTETIDLIWTAARDAAAPGAVVISHDAHHATSRREVEAGMTRAVGEAWHSYLIEPSDCGLGIWRKP